MKLILKKLCGQRLKEEIIYLGGTSQSLWIQFFRITQINPPIIILAKPDFTFGTFAIACSDKIFNTFEAKRVKAFGNTRALFTC